MFTKTAMKKNGKTITSENDVTKPKAINHTIDLKDLTFVINLKKSSATSYLDFMRACRKIKKEDKTKIITSRKIKNDFLIIEIEYSPVQEYYARQLSISLVETNIDFVAIDELFPNDNHYLLKRIDCPNTKEWVLDKVFTTETSQMIVA